MNGVTNMKQKIETSPAAPQKTARKLVYNHRSARLIFQGWKRYEEAEEEE